MAHRYLCYLDEAMVGPRGVGVYFSECLKSSRDQVCPLNLEQL